MSEVDQFPIMACPEVLYSCNGTDQSINLSIYLSILKVSDCFGTEEDLCKIQPKAK